MTYSFDKIEDVQVGVYTMPTSDPESDGTLKWEATTMVVVEVRADSVTGMGYTYSHGAAAQIIEDVLSPCLLGESAMDVGRLWLHMMQSLRNLGHVGLGAAAISAVDVALWDLKARRLDVPLVHLMGALRTRVPVYGSGGFTSYDDDQLSRQLGGWVEQGISRVKIKIGRHPDDDERRVALAREVIGEKTELFVDANGALDRKEALLMASRLQHYGVSWFEEPVSSDDLDGLRMLRDRAPSGMEITAGEYGWDIFSFRRLLEAGAVDVVQADATRCGGYTGFLQVANLCWAHNVPLSAHT
ncbi:MAG: enolase C-terminal domain-like protein, partial [Bradymonadaceae bacterium]